MSPIQLTNVLLSQLVHRTKHYTVKNKVFNKHPFRVLYVVSVFYAVFIPPRGCFITPLYIAGV